MRELTVVLPYYMNPQMLARQYAALRDLSPSLKAGVRLIVVDDGSPRDPATPEDIGLPLEIYRIKVDVRWNQDAARNLGVDRSQTKWLFLTDIDHLIPEKTFARVLEGPLERKNVYRFSRVNDVTFDNYKPHPNSWMMTRKMWERIGGYDERFAGYYGTDGDFLVRVRKCADFVVMLSAPLVRVPREVTPDASTTTYTRKDTYDKPEIRRITAEREIDPNWRPLRLQFPWERVA